jgi:hypothetical protein
MLQNGKMQENPGKSKQIQKIHEKSDKSKDSARKSDKFCNSDINVIKIQINPRNSNKFQDGHIKSGKC